MVNSSTFTTPSSSTTPNVTFDEIHSCPKCGKSYKNRKSFYHHIRYICNVVDLYKCPYCEDRYPMKKKLKEHIMESHMQPMENISYRCPKCKKLYLHRNNMLKHLSSDCAADSYLMCPYCPYQCRLKEYITQHMKRQHPDKKPLKF